MHWTNFCYKRWSWKATEIIWLACRRYFFKSLHNGLIINYLWTEIFCAAFIPRFFVTCIFDTELILILHTSVLFLAFYQDMNQETSRNDLKDQIKEIRSTNSKIKQKANKAIYAIIYNSLIKYFTYKQFKYYQAQKTHLSTSKILLCLCNLFQV